MTDIVERYRETVAIIADMTATITPVISVVEVGLKRQGNFLSVSPFSSFLFLLSSSLASPKPRSLKYSYGVCGTAER